MALVASGLSTQIYNNHLKSALLLAGFPALILGMIFCFYAGMDLLVYGPLGHGQMNWDRTFASGMEGVNALWPHALGGVLLWFAVAWFMHARMMRAATGAVPVTRRDMPRIYNMLENLCISRGIPMPAFEVIDSPALNAFATGIDDKSYRIVLTRGIIEQLSDDELEAVIAHELTHIMNRDVRLLIVATVFVGIISFLSQAAFRAMIHGRRSMYSRMPRGRGNNGGPVLLLLMLLALLILFVGKLFALGIRFALSRKREYLADAGAVRLTKNPEAMMRALMRIRDHDNIPGLPGHIAQMCIENARRDFAGLFATHPPIEDRISAISRMTGAPVPALPVTLRRPPTRPWGPANAPEALRKRGPWG